MDRWPLPAFVLTVVLVVVSGCSFFHETHKPQYETVQADPRHETAVAEAEHARALKYLNGSAGCKGCDPVKAEEHLQKALVADVTYGPAHNSMGMLYLRQGKLYLAAWEFEYAQRLMSDRFEPLYNLGLVYEAADKLDRAVEFYSMAFSIAPRTPDVLESLVRARLRNGETVANVRPLLKEILFYETRPVWICWAKDQLGLAPEQTAQNQGPLTPLPASDRRLHSPHQNPPDPPLPDEAPEYIPHKVATPILPNRLSSTAGVLDDAFSELNQTDSSGAPPSNPLAITVKRRHSDSASVEPRATTTADRPFVEAAPATMEVPSSPGAPPGQAQVLTPAKPDAGAAPGRILFSDDNSNSSP